MARAPRKIFANPFVITLATACSAPQSPPSQVTPPPAPAEPVVVANPPPPTPPQTVAYEQRWTVMKSGATCTAMQRVECPKPTTPGGPQPTCNPPPPMKIACPEGWDGAQAITVVQHANQTECRIEEPPMQCPKGAICNPPPPRTVACPTWQ